MQRLYMGHKMQGRWAAVLFMMFGVIIAKDQLQVLWDKRFAERPFVSAHLEIRPVFADVPPVIMYDADATQPVDGVWIATIHAENGQRLFTRRGPGSYNANIDNPKPWPWETFFDNERGAPSPRVPDQVFKVCVRYIIEARDTGVYDETPVFCSDYTNPEEWPK